MDPSLEHRLSLSRRSFLGLGRAGIGAAALATLLHEDLGAAGGLPGLPHFAPTAKRVIYLFQSGAPSQMELFDYKPRLKEFRGTELPDSVRRGQRLSAISSAQESFPVVPSIFNFRQHGQSGAWVSELMPRTARIADRLCFVKSMHTEAINHDPAITFFQTGFQQAGRPSIGSWISYGLGSETQNLPAFVVMVSSGSANKSDQPLYHRLWSSGFLPERYSGVSFRSGRDPVLFLSNPPGMSDAARRRFIEDVGKINQLSLREHADPEISTRIAQYEMAYRMQQSVPDLMDLSGEPPHIFDLYGPDSRTPGTFAANCLLARRLAERGVRFIQLFHRGWDQHNNLPEKLPLQARDTDQPSAALVADLEQRGLLKDTLVVWGGEFGRTVYCQGKLTADDYGRDHHPRCFTVWMAGGGIKAGITYGETDDYCYNITRDPVHVHDLHATILNCLGIDHKRLTYKFQGRQFRLTDVQGNVVSNILA